MHDAGFDIDRDLIFPVDGWKCAGGCSLGKIPITIPRNRAISGTQTSYFDGDDWSMVEIEMMDMHHE